MHEEEVIQTLEKLLVDDDMAYALLVSLREARRDTYRRIAARLDRDITGEIFQVQHGGGRRRDNVIAVGTDGIKNILFEEMGFGPDDVLSLG